jgi:hypothetical protein
MTTVRKEVQVTEGLDVRYITHNCITGNGNGYHFCYEYGFYSWTAFKLRLRSETKGITTLSTEGYPAKEKYSPGKAGGVFFFCGERGIRTLGPAKRDNGFRDRPDRPLRHLSKRNQSSVIDILQK